MQRSLLLWFFPQERTKEAAIFACEEVNRICEQYGGSKIESSIPKILRSNPFTPLNNVIGPKGERWMPIHTIVPHSKSHEAMKKIAKLLENNQSELDENKIGVGFLYTVISNNGFVIEPVFFTPDSIDEIHREVVEDNVLKNIDCFEENLDARELTLRLRAELLRLFEDIGGVHMQIGKSYNFKRGLRDEAWSLIKNIKDIIDPKKAINPGALSFYVDSIPNTLPFISPVAADEELPYNKRKSAVIRGPVGELIEIIET